MFGFVGHMLSVATTSCSFVSVQFSSVQSLSRVQLCANPRTSARQASLSITNSQSPPKPMSIGVGDAIQPSYPLSSPSPPALNLSQHQGLCQWVGSLRQVAKERIVASAVASGLPTNIQGWFPLGLTGLISLPSKGLLMKTESALKLYHDK